MNKTKIVTGTIVTSRASTSDGSVHVAVPIKSWFENPVAIITALTTIAGVLKIINGAYPEYTWIATGVSILLFVISSIQSVVPSKAIYS